MPEQIQIHMIEFERFPPGMYFKVTFTKKSFLQQKKESLICLKLFYTTSIYVSHLVETQHVTMTLIMKR